MPAIVLTAKPLQWWMTPIPTLWKCWTPTVALWQRLPPAPPPPVPGPGTSVGPQWPSPVTYCIHSSSNCCLFYSSVCGCVCVCVCVCVWVHTCMRVPMWLNDFCYLFIVCCSPFPPPPDCVLIIITYMHSYCKVHCAHCSWGSIKNLYY